MIMPENGYGDTDDQRWSKAPFTQLRFHMKMEEDIYVFALSSHCSAVKTEPIGNANENKEI